MVEELRSLNKDDASGRFIPYGKLGAPHLSEEGNRWVVRRLLDRGVVPALVPSGASRDLGLSAPQLRAIGRPTWI